MATPTQKDTMSVMTTVIDPKRSSAPCFNAPPGALFDGIPHAESRPPSSGTPLRNDDRRRRTACSDPSCASRTRRHRPRTYPRTAGRVAMPSRCLAPSRRMPIGTSAHSQCPARCNARGQQRLSRANRPLNSGRRRLRIPRRLQCNPDSSRVTLRSPNGVSLKSDRMGRAAVLRATAKHRLTLESAPGCTLA